MAGRKQAQVFATAFNTYTSSKQLGQGGVGTVFCAASSDGSEVAIKVLTHPETNSEKRSRFKNEIHFLMRHQHQNLVRVLDYGITADGRPFYVMERYQGSLRDEAFFSLSPDKKLDVFSQILNGVEAAHLKQAVHRDLKPENILWRSDFNDIVVADFGVARLHQDDLLTAVETRMASRLANFSYAAPEQKIRGAPVGVAADIYALGLMLNEMYTRQTPVGTGYKLVGAVHEDLAFLDRIVDVMTRQAPDDRPKTIAEVKSNIETYRRDFVLHQKISREGEVVPDLQVDDPLALKPPALLGLDYQDGQLVLVLDRPVTPRWIESFQKMGNYRYDVNHPKGGFTFRDNKAYVKLMHAGVANKVAAYFKEWLVATSEILKQDLQVEARRKDAVRRAALEKTRREIEMREAIRSSFQSGS